FRNSAMRVVATAAQATGRWWRYLKTPCPDSLRQASRRTSRSNALVTSDGPGFGNISLRLARLARHGVRFRHNLIQERLAERFESGLSGRFQSVFHCVRNR